MFEEKQISPPARFTWIALRSFVNRYGGGAFPSNKTLSRMTGYCDKTIRDATKALYAAGLLSRSREKTGKVYNYSLPPLADTALPGKKYRTSPVTDADDHTHRSETIDHTQEQKAVADLLGRYDGSRDLVVGALEAIATTRKLGKISDGKKQRILEDLEKHPEENVLAGIRIYLDRECAAEGKDERYLMGIIRGESKRQTAQQQRAQRRAEIMQPGR